MDSSFTPLSQSTQKTRELLEGVAKEKVKSVGTLEERKKQIAQDAEKSADLLPGGFLEGFLGGKTKVKGEDLSPIVENSKKILAEMKEFSDEEKKILEADFEDIRQACTFLSEGKKDELIKQFEEGLRNRNRFVLPVITSPTEDSPNGHMFPVVFTQATDKSPIICTILNKGEGNEFHRTFPGERKKKVSLTYSLTISRDDFPLLKEHFFPAWIDSPTTTWTPATVYGYLEQMQDKQNPSVEFVKDEATIQYPESPALAFSHYIIRNFMVNNKKAETYKKYIALEKSEFFRSFYCHLKKLSSEESKIEQVESLLPSLKKALRSYQRTVIKGEGSLFLSQEDLVNCQAITELLEEEIREIEKTRLANKRLSFSQPTLEVKDAVNVTLVQPEFVKTLEGSPFSGFQEILGSNLTRLTPENFLEHIRKIQSSLDNPQVVLFDKGIMMHTFFSHLPLANDLFWDNIPGEEVKEALQTLLDSFEAFSKSYVDLYGTERNTTFLPWILLDQLALYGAVFRLARRVPDLKMDKYCPPPFTFENPEMLFFPLEKDAKRWEELWTGLREWQRTCAQDDNVTFDGWIGVVDESLWHAFRESNYIQKDPDIRLKSGHQAYFNKFPPKGCPDLYRSLSQCFFRTCLLTNLAHVMGREQLDFIYSNPLKESRVSGFKSGTFVVAEHQWKNAFPAETEFAFDKTALMIEPKEKARQKRKTQNPFRSDLIDDNEIIKILLSEDKQTENEILLRSPYLDPKQDLSFYHRLQKIQNNKEWSLIGLISLCEEDAHFLESASNRQTIEELFLRNDQLVQSLKKEPLLLDRLRKAIDRQIEGNVTYMNAELVFYWVRLGIHIEHRWALSQKNSIDRDPLKKLVGHLDKLQEKLEGEKDPNSGCSIWDRDIALHKAYVLAVASPEEEELVTRLTEAWVAGQQAFVPFKSLSPSWLVFETARLIRENPTFAPEKRKQFENAIKKGITQFLEIQEQNATCDFTQFPLVECTVAGRKYTLSFWEGGMADDGKRLKKVSIPWDRLNAFEKKLVAERVTDLVSEGESFSARNGKSFHLAVSPKNNDVRIEKEFTFGGVSATYVYQKRSRVQLPGDHPLANKTTLWMKKDAKGSSQEGMILNKDEIPLAKVFIENGSGKTQFVRVDNRGAELNPRQYALTLDTSNPLCQTLWTKAIYSPAKTLFWVDHKGVTTQIELPPQTDKLILTYDAPDKIHSNLLGQEYKLAAEQDMPLLNYFSGALLFESDKGEQKILLPGLRVSGEEEKEFLLPFTKDEKNYYEVSIDEKQGQLFAKSTEGRLYLIYLFLAQKDYKKADQYLRELHPIELFSEREQKLIEEIFHLARNEKDPALLTLQTHLSILVKDNGCVTSNIALNSSIAKTVTDYVELLQKNRISLVPADMQVPLSELLVMIDWLTDKGLAPSLKGVANTMKDEEAKGKREVRGRTVTTPHKTLTLTQKMIEQWYLQLEPKENAIELFKQELSISDDSLPLKKNAINYTESIKNPSELLKKSAYNLYDDLKSNALKNAVGDGDKRIDVLLYELFLQRDKLTEVQRYFLGTLYYLRFNATQRNECSLLLLKTELKLQKNTSSSNRREETRESVPYFPILPIGTNKKGVQEKLWKEYQKSIPSHEKYLVDDPFEQIRNTYFDEPQAHPIYPETAKEFALKEISFRDDEPLANAMLANMKKAHNASYEHRRVYAYSLKGDEEKKKNLKEELEQAFQTVDQERKDLREKIETLANSHDLRSQLQQKVDQAERITIHDILLNPEYALPKDIGECQNNVFFLAVLKYMELSTFVDRVQQAKEALEQGKVQEAGEIFDRKRLYDPFAYPELLMYEYFSGNQLRSEPNQAEILQKIFKAVFDPKPEGREEEKDEIRKLFFEFQAGGGKTKVLSTIIALKAVREGKHPVFFSLPDLRDVTKVDLRDSLTQMFKVGLNVIQISLHDQLDVASLRALFEKIERAHQAGKCDFMTPETWHALHLNFKESLMDNDFEKADWVQKILRHYRKNGLFLVDEAHVNVDSLLSANIAFGEPPIVLNPEEQRLYVDALKALIGIGGDDCLRDENGESITEDFLGILKNEQAIRIKNYADVLPKMLAAFFSEHPIAAKLTPEQKKQYIEFLINKKSEKPGWLKDMYGTYEGEQRDKARLLVLAKGMIHSILPHSLGFAYYMNYGPSEGKDDYAFCPWENKNPSTAKFQKIDVTGNITVQGYFQKGLDAHEMKVCCEQIFEEYQTQKGAGLENDVIGAFKLLDGALQTIPERERFTFHQVKQKLEDPRFMEGLAEKIGKNTQLIERFLLTKAFSSITSFPYMFTSTSANFQGRGAASFVSFSATLGSGEKYALSDLDEEFHPQNAFMAGVAHTSCLPENRTTHVVSSVNPGALFNEVYQKDPEGFKELEGWINVGGFAKEEQSVNIAKTFLAFAKEKDLDYEGVVYFKSILNEKSGKGEKVLFLLKRGKNGEPDSEIRIEGSDLKSELAKYNVRVERIFKIYDPSETTGTDLFLSPSAKMMITLGEGVTASRLAQAIMRMRRFLIPRQDPKQAQRILWIIPQLFYNQMEKDLDETLTADNQQELFWKWVIRKEAEIQKDQILSMAQEDIEHVFWDAIWTDIENAAGVKAKEDLVGKHKEAIRRTIKRDPYELWGSRTESKGTQKYLEETAKSISEEWKKPIDAKMQDKINRIIRRTQAVIEQVESGTSDNNQTAQQRNRQQQKQQQKQQSTTGRRANLWQPVEPEKEYAKGELSLEKGGLSAAKTGETIRSANEIYKTMILPTNLYILRNAFTSIKADQDTFPSRMLKPVDQVLLLHDPSKSGEEAWKAFCVSLSDGLSYREQLAQGQIQDGIRAALFSATGKIIQNGKPPHGIENLREIEEGNHNETRNIFRATALLNGIVLDKDYIEGLCNRDEEAFEKFWEETKKRAIEHKKYAVSIAGNVLQTRKQMRIDEQREKQRAEKTAAIKKKKAEEEEAKKAEEERHLQEEYQTKSAELHTIGLQLERTTDEYTRAKNTADEYIKNLTEERKSFPDIQEKITKLSEKEKEVTEKLEGLRENAGISRDDGVKGSTKDEIALCEKMIEGKNAMMRLHQEAKEKIESILSEIKSFIQTKEEEIEQKTKVYEASKAPIDQMIMRIETKIGSFKKSEAIKINEILAITETIAELDRTQWEGFKEQWSEITTDWGKLSSDKTKVSVQALPTFASKEEEWIALSAQLEKAKDKFNNFDQKVTGELSSLKQSVNVTYEKIKNVLDNKAKNHKLLAEIKEKEDKITYLLQPVKIEFEFITNYFVDVFEYNEDEIEEKVKTFKESKTKYSNLIQEIDKELRESQTKKDDPTCQLENLKTLYQRCQENVDTINNAIDQVYPYYLIYEKCQILLIEIKKLFNSTVDENIKNSLNKLSQAICKLSDENNDSFSEFSEKTLSPEEKEGLKQKVINCQDLWNEIKENLNAVSSDSIQSESSAETAENQQSEEDKEVKQPSSSTTPSGQAPAPATETKDPSTKPPVPTTKEIEEETYDQFGEPDSLQDTSDELPTTASEEKVEERNDQGPAPEETSETLGAAPVSTTTTSDEPSTRTPAQSQISDTSGLEEKVEERNDQGPAPEETSETLGAAPVSTTTTSDQTSTPTPAESQTSDTSGLSSPRAESSPTTENKEEIVDQFREPYSPTTTHTSDELTTTSSGQEPAPATETKETSTKPPVPTATNSDRTSTPKPGDKTPVQSQTPVVPGTSSESTKPIGEEEETVITNSGQPTPSQTPAKTPAQSETTVPLGGPSNTTTQISEKEKPEPNPGSTKVSSTPGDKTPQLEKSTGSEKGRQPGAPQPSDTLGPTSTIPSTSSPTTSSTSKIAAQVMKPGQRMRNKWKTSLAFRIFSFISLGIVPLFTYFSYSRKYQTEIKKEGRSQPRA